MEDSPPTRPPFAASCGILAKKRLRMEPGHTRDTRGTQAHGSHRRTSQPSKLTNAPAGPHEHDRIRGRLNRQPQPTGILCPVQRHRGSRDSLDVTFFGRARSRRYPILDSSRAVSPKRIFPESRGRLRRPPWGQHGHAREAPGSPRARSDPRGGAGSETVETQWRGVVSFSNRRQIETRMV